MINFRFVKSQFKNVRLVLIIFFIIFFILLVPALTQKYLAESMTRIMTPDGGISGYGGVGAMPYLNNTFFGIPGFILIFSFSLILNHILVSKEIDKGYLASWLTTPMSRKTIFNSKLFVLLASILMLYLSMFIIQLIIFPLIFQDFSFQAFAYLLLYNCGLILLAILWAAINWFFIASINKTVISLSVAAGVSVVFVLFQTMSSFAMIPGLEFFKYFKYMTITSLFNSPFKFGPVPSLHYPPTSVPEVAIAPLLQIKALDFAWQYPVMLLLPYGLFYLGNNFLIKKDLSL